AAVVLRAVCGAERRRPRPPLFPYTTLFRSMGTGAAMATINRLPVRLLPGDIFANRLPHPVLQGLEHPHGEDVSVNGAFRPVSAYWDRIYRPEQVLSALPRAMQVLTDPALTGAVTICLPQDVQ